MIDSLTHLFDREAVHSENTKITHCCLNIRWIYLIFSPIFKEPHAILANNFLHRVYQYLIKLLNLLLYLRWIKIFYISQFFPLTWNVKEKSNNISKKSKTFHPIEKIMMKTDVIFL